jgi:hypothetical protein
MKNEIFQVYLKFYIFWSQSQLLWPEDLNLILTLKLETPEILTMLLRLKIWVISFSLKVNTSKYKQSIAKNKPAQLRP